MKIYNCKANMTLFSLIAPPIYHITASFLTFNIISIYSDIINNKFNSDTLNLPIYIFCFFLTLLGAHFLFQNCSKPLLLLSASLTSLLSIAMYFYSTCTFSMDHPEMIMPEVYAQMITAWCQCIRILLEDYAHFSRSLAMVIKDLSPLLFVVVTKRSNYKLKTSHPETYDYLALLKNIYKTKDYIFYSIKILLLIMAIIANYAVYLSTDNRSLLPQNNASPVAISIFQPIGSDKYLRKELKSSESIDKAIDILKQAHYDQRSRVESDIDEEGAYNGIIRIHIQYSDGSEWRICVYYGGYRADRIYISLNDEKMYKGYWHDTFRFWLLFDSPEELVSSQFISNTHTALHKNL